MNPAYRIQDTSAVFSPALLFYKDLIVRNIRYAVELAGSPDRLRPHVKTHKTREIVQLALEAGRDEVDVEMAVHDESSVLIRELQDAVSAADRLCEERKLLTLASSRDLRELRRWMTEEIVAQIEQRREPVPWPAWLSDRDLDLDLDEPGVPR